MKVSYNWLQEYLDFELPAVEQLVELIGAQLGEVEAVTAIGPKYQGIVIARIVQCSPVEDSDHLNLCLIDDGQAVPDVERNEAGMVQVVCGAPNVRAGMLVAWLPPGVTVPSSSDNDPFVLGARKLRGHMSNGMLASPQELAIGDDHSGILEVDVVCPAGSGFADVYGLNDHIIDIENKMFTHRPDCFGIIGIAREVAGILGKQFTEPDWYAAVPALSPGSDESLSLTVKNEAPDLVPRFMAVTLRGLTVGPSPVRTRTLLTRVGIRPISNIVDVTNLVMHLTGQPLHAYDYDKVNALDESDTATLTARLVRSDESLVLLNGKSIVPRPEAIVIATESTIIGLAGVMGGASTEVDANTKNIILECATFDMYSIRRTSMSHGLFSEAVTRFTKGQSPYQNDRILNLAVQLLTDTSDATVASEVADSWGKGFDPANSDSVSVQVTAGFINARLGMEMSRQQISDILTNVGFMVQTDGTDNLSITAPFWRTDIAIREDIVEEVGRLYGYDKLPLSLPDRDSEPAPVNQLLQFKTRLRTYLSQAGANEVLTYSFVHGDLLRKVGQAADKSYRLTNALSPDVQYYRQSLTPSLLEKLQPNVRAGYDSFALFELGKSHVIEPLESSPDGIPAASERLALVFTADARAAKRYDGAAYFQAKKYLVSLFAAFAVNGKVTYSAETPETYFQAGRTASIQVDGQTIGVIGEYGTAVKKALKLPDYTAGFEIDIVQLLKLTAATKSYQPLPKYPKVAQDICLRVPAATSFASVAEVASKVVQDYSGQDGRSTVTPVDIFAKADDEDFKQITLRVETANYHRTLTAVEVSTLLQKIADTAAETLGAEQV